jgi:RNA polymerase sigma-70 factor, ECF subfamily
MLPGGRGYTVRLLIGIERDAIGCIMSESEILSVVEMAKLGKLCAEHQPTLLAMVRRRIDPSLVARMDPEEILNEAFLVARRRWEEFQKNSTMRPYPWLYRIVLDCLIDAWRRETRGMRDHRRDLPWPERSSIQLGMRLVAPNTSPSEALARKELRERMRQLVGLMKSEDQEILWMRHNDQLSFKEAAEVLGTTENNASKRYARALRQLKVLWEGVQSTGE